jgi:chromosome segregation ATPase
LELQGELVGSRVRLDQLDDERRSHGLAIGELRQELHGAHSESEARRRSRDKLFQELTEARRRIDRGVPQVADYRRRLANTEDALNRAQAEVTEERRARERCHLEVVRAAEKLRVVRSQGDQLR